MWTSGVGGCGRTRARDRQEAVRGSDGTAEWFAPILETRRLADRPLTPDLYGGTLASRSSCTGTSTRWRLAARPVDGVADLLEGTIQTARRTSTGGPNKPPTQAPPRPHRRYIGLGSQIWCWLTLGHVDDASSSPTSSPSRSTPAKAPIWSGHRGAIVPLLKLANQTGDNRWARPRDPYRRPVGGRGAAPGTRQVCWRCRTGPPGSAGSPTAPRDRLVTGETVAATDVKRFSRLADEAAAYEETCTRRTRGWLDRASRRRWWPRCATARWGSGWRDRPDGPWVRPWTATPTSSPGRRRPPNTAGSGGPTPLPRRHGRVGTHQQRPELDPDRMETYAPRPGWRVRCTHRA